MHDPERKIVGERAEADGVIEPAKLERLERAGIPRDSITILIATGLHRPATDSEICEIVGSSIAANYRSADLAVYSFNCPAGIRHVA